MRRSFLFSPEVSVDLELKYERCFSICVACGFLLHGLEGFDKAFVQSAIPPSSLSFEGLKVPSSNFENVQVIPPSGRVVAAGLGTKLVTGEEVVVVTAIPKPCFPGLGVNNPFLSIDKLGMYPWTVIGAVLKSLFSVKGFSAQAFAEISKLRQPTEEVSMDGELSMDSLSQLSGSQHLTIVLLNQLGKKVKMVENLDYSKGWNLLLFLTWL